MSVGGGPQCSFSASSLLVHAWDEVLDSERSNKVLENLIVSDLDVGDLDLGFVWNEVHLSFSLLL